MVSTQEAQKQLHTLVRQVRADTERENDQRHRMLRQAEEQGASRAETAQDQLMRIGLSENDLSADKQVADDRRQEREQISQSLAQSSSSGDLDIQRVDLGAGLAPPDVQVLAPVLSSVQVSPFTHSEAQADGPAADYYYNNVQHNPWAWAQGAGSGIAGTGVGEFSIQSDFWFYFVPQVNRFYGINPYTTYRGFYIVQSDDHWYDSHFARVVVTSSVDVHQYNWKGMNSFDVLNVGNDNINVNSRFDTTRNHYYSALLGANDGVWILNRVRLYVYARGGSAYAKLDFGTGAANYLVAPYVYIS